jgi:pyruvate/2-oxoglutarate dehydrogenase complex dihydrolipoamide dehydrogenase (E3) component
VRRAAGGSGAVLTLREGSGRTSEVSASAVLVATGRRPNTDDLGLETVGAKTDEKGFLRCDKRLATSVRGIWAAGDIRGGPMFTHTAWDDNRVLVSQLAGNRSRTTDRIVPYAIYTDPQLGRVGMTEAEARRGGRRVRVGRYAMKSNGKAREIGETNGFIQVVVDARTEKILGAAVLAAEGAEIVHLYVDVMNAGGKASAIRNAVHIHPTLAEAVQSAVEAAMSAKAPK